jgi:hypothetical protein
MKIYKMIAIITISFTLPIHTEQFSADTHLAKNSSNKTIILSFCGYDTQKQSICTDRFILTPGQLTSIFNMTQVTIFEYPTLDNSSRKIPVNSRELNMTNGLYDIPVSPQTAANASMLEYVIDEHGTAYIRVIPLNTQQQQVATPPPPAPVQQFSSDSHLIKNSTDEELVGITLCNTIYTQDPNRLCQDIQRIEPKQTTPMIKLNKVARIFYTPKVVKPGNMWIVPEAINMWELNPANGLYDKPASQQIRENASLLDLYKDSNGVINARVIPLNS